MKSVTPKELRGNLENLLDRITQTILDRQLELVIQNGIGNLIGGYIGGMFGRNSRPNIAPVNLDGNTSKNNHLLRIVCVIPDLKHTPQACFLLCASHL